MAKNAKLKWMRRNGMMNASGVFNRKGQSIVRNSWDEQLKQEIIENIASEVYPRCINAIRYASDVTAWAAGNINRRDGVNLMGFHNVTGNLFASMGFVVVRVNNKTGRLVTSYQLAPINQNDGRTRPTRVQLTYHEMYDKKRYFSGYSPEEEGTRPFVAPTPADHIYGGAERMKTLRQLRDSGLGGSRAGSFFHIYGFIASPYARYIEGKHHIDLMKGSQGLITFIKEGIQDNF